MTMYRKIEINEKIRKTTDGRTEETTTLFYKPYANIYQLYGTMLFEAINIGYEETIVFELRTCAKAKELLNNPKKYAIQYNNKSYDIFYADYKKDNDGVIQFKCYRVS